MARRGRPSIYSDEVADKLLVAIAMDESLDAICKRPGMPSHQTVFRWLKDKEDFRENYARAREMQAESASHRMRGIEGKVEKSQLDPNAARVILDSIKWRASKLAPKKFGDRLQVDQNVNVDVSKLSDEEFQTLLIDEWRRVSLSDAIPLDLFEEVLEERKKAVGG